MMERIDLESKTDIKNFQQGNVKLEIVDKYTPSICAGIRYLRDYKINVILDKCNHFDVWSLLILEMFINYIYDFELDSFTDFGSKRFGIWFDDSLYVQPRMHS